MPAWAGAESRAEMAERKRLGIWVIVGNDVKGRLEKLKSADGRT